VRRAPGVAGSHATPPPPPPEGRGGGGRGAPGGGRGGSPFGGGGGRGGVAAAGEWPHRAGRGQPGQQIREDLVSARKALKDKNWGLAQQLASSIIGNAEASKSQQKQAENILQGGPRQAAAARRSARRGMPPARWPSSSIPARTAKSRSGPTMIPSSPARLSLPFARQALEPLRRPASGAGRPRPGRPGRAGRRVVAARRPDHRRPAPALLRPRPIYGETAATSKSTPGTRATGSSRTSRSRSAT